MGTPRWNYEDLATWTKKHAQGKTLNLMGLQSHYVEKGEGEPLILLHGFIFDHHLWDPNIEALAKQYKVYALDLWGFGASTREKLHYSYDLYVKQLLAFMDALTLSKAHLMGQSMGGGTIIRFTRQHPHRVKKLILVDPAGLPTPLPLTSKIFQLPGVGETLLNFPGFKIRRHNLLKFFIHRPEILTQAFLENLTRFHQVKGTTAALLGVLRNNFFDTLTEDIKALSQQNASILIFWGKEEKVLPIKIGLKLKEILPRAQFEIIENSGHCPNLDSAKEVNAMTLAFLKKD